MADAYLDTDVILRLLTKDDPQKEADAAALFERVRAGLVTVRAPDTVIADAVYVLASPKLYHHPRQHVAAELIRLVTIPGFLVDNRQVVVRALEVYGTTKLDFGDAMVLAAMEAAGQSTVCSYDHDYNQPGVTRLEPSALIGNQP